MSKADSIIAYGLAEVGKPYHFGDEGPNAFDCSGLMQYIFGKAGIKLPRTAAEQQKFATPVTKPVPGDLVFFGAPAHHVGLYLGGGRMLAAPHTGANVRVQSVGDATNYGRISGAGTGAAAQLVGNVTTPIANVFDWSGLLDKLADDGRILMFVAGGAGLVLTGLWVTVKGKS
jgi:cell wall-associated NlpC family hydrolase